MCICRKYPIWLLFLVLPGFISISCDKNSSEGNLIITEAPVTVRNDTTDSLHFIPGARIVMLDPGSKTPELLTSRFYSACSPDISWDGSHMIFAAQEKENDTWQIWEMKLANREFRKLTSGDANCTDPVYLPNGNFIFTKTVEKGNALFSAAANESEIRQLTFHPHNNFGTSILADGRLITVTRQIYPEYSDPMLMVIRPDGTKGNAFYKGHIGCRFAGKVREGSDGRIYFIEGDSYAGSNNQLASISYNIPLHSFKLYSGEFTGSFRAVFPVETGKLLVSYRKNESENYSLYEFDSAEKQLGKQLYKPDKANVVDVAMVMQKTRPKKLPSEVDMGVKTGLLLCQDVNFTELGLDDLPEVRSNRIEINGIDSSMGIVHVAKDGSVYLKVVADRPFQIQKLDDHGKVTVQSAWIWIRPNERRGCVGCHENPELAPENIVPLSIKKDPVSVPVQITDIAEKEVELE
jgi:hypothetical protein